MNKAISVSRLNSYIKTLISNDGVLSDILVRGEISNFKHHHSGHMYFTLKDDRAAVRCVMFSSNAGRLGFRPEDGMQVTVSGYISVYEKTGQYQLYANGMLEEGEGALYLKFEKLKKKLDAEGLFDESLKKDLPFIPEGIGVVTSSTGSVIRDIMNVLDRRFPGYRLVLYPSHVQGKGAEIEIASGIEYFNRRDDIDVIIIARGGGSIEDLWPFNEEHLARAIHVSRIPIISAVGHETDFTIADFAADMRAPTPSAAAEIVVPELTAVKNTLRIAKERISIAVNNLINDKAARLRAFRERPVMKRPEEIFNIAAMGIDRNAERLRNAYERLYDSSEARYRELAGKMELLSPLATIGRGYSIITDDDSHVITSVKDINEGDSFSARLTDGTIRGIVKEVEAENE